MNVLLLRDVTEPQRVELGEVLADCVAGGASVNFMLPFGFDRAQTYWETVARDLDTGHRVLFVAHDERGICGTVQLLLAPQENQPHRAEVTKMLVHRRARRRGVGAALLRAAEAHALALGRTLLVLDTASEDAERLYSRLGWIRVGVVPDYALLPGGGWCDTTIFYRALAPAGGA
jgi:GNAT superfamily N-acetyltransferase